MLEENPLFHAAAVQIVERVPSEQSLAYGCQSTRHPVDSSHCQLVTGQLVTRSTRHAVDSSQSGGHLVTSKHQSRTAAAVISLPVVLDRRHYSKKCTRNWAENKVNKAHAVFCQRVIVSICDRCSNQLLCSSWNHRHCASAAGKWSNNSSTETPVRLHPIDVDRLQHVAAFVVVQLTLLKESSHIRRQRLMRSILSGVMS